MSIKLRRLPVIRNILAYRVMVRESRDILNEARDADNPKIREAYCRYADKLVYDFERSHPMYLFKTGKIKARIAYMRSIDSKV